MVGLSKMLFILLLLICLGSQIESDGSNHRYSKGDIVPFYANIVAPFSNPRETNAYYDLPFCSPDTVIEKKLNLGEMLNGDRLVSTPFKLEFLVDKDNELLCNKTLGRTDVSQFTSVIEKDYYMQFYYDDLPIWAFIGWIQKGYTDEMIKNKNKYFLYKHFDIQVFYNKDRVIEVSLRTAQDSVAISHILLSRRYSHDVEEYQMADNQEETGWKNIHGHVFRFPQHKSLFSAALGSGTQLLLLIVSMLILGLLGFFQPYLRGVFWNALVIIYAVTSVVSGYTSVSFYSQLEGTSWMKNILLSGGIYFGPLFLTFGFLNSVAIFYGTTAALPLRAIVILSLWWLFLASPLLLLGGIVGKNKMFVFQAPCRTAKCHREIPTLRWHRGLLPQMALAGILPFGVACVQLYFILGTVWGHRIHTLYSSLSVVFILLLIITALVSVALTYFQLAAEDHEWWWRSFFCGGSTGLFMYVYCIYYFIEKSNMSGFMQSSFFFGYMACVCYGMFLVLGSVGFRASLLFVRYLYAAIKCD